MNGFLRFSAVFAALALFGAGCFGVAPATPQDDALNAIHFIPGDTFEVKSAQGDTRTVTVKRFAPMNHAEIEWSVTKDGVSTTGTVTNINLQNSHAAQLPAYWQKGKQSLADEKTGIWLSDDAFQELSRTKQTILNYGIFDEDAQTISKSDPGFKTAYDALRQRAGTDGKTHDLTLMKADAEPIEWKLSVNGKERTVSAWKARNWFGEIIVLNDRQNPLILKLNLNQDEFMDKVYAYEIVNIEMKR